MNSGVQLPKYHTNDPNFSAHALKDTPGSTDTELRRLKLNPGAHHVSGWITMHTEFPTSESLLFQ